MKLGGQADVVTGATIKCSRGTKESTVIVAPIEMNIFYSTLPRVPEDATKKGINIKDFGICKKQNVPCNQVMNLAEK